MSTKILLMILTWISYSFPLVDGQNSTCESLGKTWAVEHIIDIIQWDFTDLNQVNFCQEQCRETPLCVALTQRFLGNETMQCVLFKASIYYDTMIDCGDDYSGFYRCSR